MQTVWYGLRKVAGFAIVGLASMRCCNNDVDFTTWLIQRVLQVEPPLYACSCYTVNTCASLAQSHNVLLHTEQTIICLTQTNPQRPQQATDRKQFETTINTVNLRLSRLTMRKPVMCGCRWWYEKQSGSESHDSAVQLANTASHVLDATPAPIHCRPPCNSPALLLHSFAAFLLHQWVIWAALSAWFILMS